MPGGPRGPVPKRSDQRRRRNKPEEGQATDVVQLPAMEVEHEPADSEWHPSAVKLYESLGKSGQSQFFEPSDWAFARVLCELLSRALYAEKIPAMLISSVMADLSRLGVTEGDRRRMRIELERGAEPEERASVVMMAKYKRAAGKR